MSVVAVFSDTSVLAAALPSARLVLLAQSRRGYGNLVRWITVARRRAPKGHYLAHRGDVEGKMRPREEGARSRWRGQEDTRPSRRAGVDIAASPKVEEVNARRAKVRAMMDVEKPPRATVAATRRRS